MVLGTEVETDRHANAIGVGFVGSVRVEENNPVVAADGEVGGPDELADTQAHLEAVPEDL